MDYPNKLEKVKGLDNQSYIIVVYFMQVMKCRDNEGVEIIRCSLIISGVGTVAAVAALATTPFRPEINIHNLLLYIRSLGTQAASLCSYTIKRSKSWW